MIIDYNLIVFFPIALVLVASAVPVALAAILALVAFVALVASAFDSTNNRSARAAQVTLACRLNCVRVVFLTPIFFVLLFLSAYNAPSAHAHVVIVSLRSGVPDRYLARA